MYSRQPYTFDRVVRMLISLGAIIIGIWLLNTLKGVLLPFCVACLIAYIFEPFVQYNRRFLHLNGRTMAIFVTLFEFATLFGILCYFMVPSMVDEFGQVSDLFRRYATEKIEVPFLPSGVHDFLRETIDFNSLSATLAKQDIDTLIEQGTHLLSSGINVTLGILNWALVLLYVVFIMHDYEKLMQSFRTLIPPKYRHQAFRLGSDIKRSMNHYFRGQALVSLCVGILFCIGFTIIGLPLGIMLGLIIGVMNMVPYLQLISLIPTSLLCLVYSVDQGIDFWTLWWECIAVYCVVQLIQDLFLTPRIMGKAMGMNPAIILLSLSIWGTLLGMVGLIIALPLTTLLIAYYDKYVLKSQDHHKPRGAARRKSAAEATESSSGK